MPIIHNKAFLEDLLIKNNVPLSDAVKRGEFYKKYFDWVALSKEYESGKSIRDISKMTGLSYDVIRNNLIDILGSLREFKHTGSYSFYENKFFPIPDEEASYFLGWMCSDGCNTGTKITITLQKRDAEHLSYLAGLVSNKLIKSVSLGASFDYFSVSLCKKFEDIGILKNKSHRDLKFDMSIFTAETFPYFVLGLLEGDGSISKFNPSCQLLMSHNMWNDVFIELAGSIDLSNIQVHKLNQYNLYSIIFRGRSYFSFLLYIYQNTKKVKSLERKYKLFLNQIERSACGKTSPYKKIAVNVRDILTH